MKHIIDFISEHLNFTSKSVSLNERLNFTSESVSLNERLNLNKDSKIAKPKIDIDIKKNREEGRKIL